MQQVRLFLLEFQAQNTDLLTPLRAALSAAGHLVTPVQIHPDALNGTDESALRVLRDIRAAKTDASAIVIGVGLAASFALWMDTLDLAKPKTVRLGSQMVPLENEWAFGPALSGVIVIHPFLGFDFSLSGRPAKAEGVAEWRLAASRGRLKGLLGGFAVTRADDHGLLASARHVYWGQLAQCLPFSSVAKLVPSIKRPTVMILDCADASDRIEVELCALSAKVRVMDSPAAFPQLAHVTLAAVDSLQKGAAPTDG
ncbi:MAG: hypothetical protein FGM18_05080 [Burkholderiaceae bacterium]|nr:hypothetical protein [Burkholderiaceae bacterium]